MKAEEEFMMRVRVRDFIDARIKAAKLPTKEQRQAEEKRISDEVATLPVEFQRLYDEYFAPSLSVPKKQNQTPKPSAALRKEPSPTWLLALLIPAILYGSHFAAYQYGKSTGAKDVAEQIDSNARDRLFIQERIQQLQTEIQALPQSHARELETKQSLLEFYQSQQSTAPNKP